jgi:glutamine phosphoribosylpyrophosphate amidotransferase
MDPASGPEGLEQTPFEGVDPLAVASADKQLVRHHRAESEVPAVFRNGSWRILGGATVVAHKRTSAVGE